MSLISPKTFVYDDLKWHRKQRMNFYHCIKPLCSISRVFGLLPFTIDLDPNGNIKRARVSVSNACWFICFIAATVVAFYFVETATVQQADLESSVLFVSEQLFWFSGIFMLFLSMILDMLNRNRLVKILQDFIAFDESVRKKTLHSIQHSWKMILFLLVDRIIWNFHQFQTHQKPNLSSHCYVHCNSTNLGIDIGFLFTMQSCDRLRCIDALFGTFCVLLAKFSLRLRHPSIPGKYFVYFFYE